MDLTTQWHTGDAVTIIRTLPAESVDLILTSPPFLALRSYLPDDHPDKHVEVGSESTPGEFVDKILDMVVEARRVLAPHGSLVIELGDTYAGSGGGGDYLEGGLREGQAQFAGSQASARESNAAHWRQKAKGRDAWPMAKSLTLIPESVRFALVYGRNPHTGREIEPWRIRKVVRWVRPNPPVGMLGDKFRPATSEILVACVSGDRYFDLDAVRVRNDRTVEEPAVTRRHVDGGETMAKAYTDKGEGERMVQNPNGSPPLDWWNVPTQPYAGSHYAVWPPKLLTRLVQSMCPKKVCVTCGEPSRRMIELDNPLNMSSEKVTNTKKGGYQEGRMPRAPDHDPGRSTIGWSDCSHDTWRRGVILDPYAGTGTTLQVASGHGFSSIGIDLDERNTQLAEKRIGMFLEMRS